MIKCPSCGKNHPENTLFCDECGAYVLSEGQKRTDSMASSDVAWMEVELELDNSFDMANAHPLKIRALILDSGRQIELTMNKEINIGRLDATSATFPEIDLTEDQGMSKGVSRRHAKITRKGSALFLEDLGSLNGTFLNGRRLTPYLPHALNDSDEIRLSKLSLTIHFSQT